MVRITRLRRGRLLRDERGVWGAASLGAFGGRDDATLPAGVRGTAVLRPRPRRVRLVSSRWGSVAGEFISSANSSSGASAPGGAGSSAFDVGARYAGVTTWTTSRGGNP